MSKKQGKKTIHVLEKVAFDEDFDGLTLTGEAEKRLLQALNAKAVVLKKEKTGIQDMKHVRSDVHCDENLLGLLHRPSQKQQIASRCTEVQYPNGPELAI